jgi:hypothetical protein
VDSAIEFRGLVNSHLDSLYNYALVLVCSLLAASDRPAGAAPAELGAK